MTFCLNTSALHCEATIYIDAPSQDFVALVQAQRRELLFLIGEEPGPLIITV